MTRRLLTVAFLGAIATLSSASEDDPTTVNSSIAFANAQASEAEEPAVKEGAVMYGVVPTLFGEEPFKAVRAKLDYLQRQGVDILWISPIQKTDDPSAISYSVTDYFALREDFGSAEDFRALVQEAKARKMKVIMDFVPNHTSNGHPFYQDAEKKGASSVYYSFYDRDEKGNPTHYFDWKHLPNLNFENPEVTRFIFSSLRYWIQEYGLDGFRMDAAWGIQKRTPKFWPGMIQRLNALNPKIIVVAEATARDPYFSESGFNLAYDWTNKLGKWAWTGIFDEPSLSGKRLSALFTKHPPASDVIRFLNNNDTGRRFLSKHGAGVTKVAAVLQHTLPGVALVYTGDEVGAEYEPYEDPSPISWKDPHQLQALYRKLAELRENLPALRSGTKTGVWTLVPISNSDSAFAFIRSTSRAGEEVLVLLNFSHKQVVEFKLPSPIKTTLSSGRAWDWLSGTSVPLLSTGADKDASWSVNMEAESALILRLSEDHRVQQTVVIDDKPARNNGSVSTP